MPRVVIRSPPEKVLKAPLPYCSWLAARIPERTMIHRPKRTRVSENISNTFKRMFAAIVAADTAKTRIRMPSERTPTGLLGIRPHNLLCSADDY